MPILPKGQSQTKKEFQTTIRIGLTHEKYFANPENIQYLECIYIQYALIFSEILKQNKHKLRCQTFFFKYRCGNLTFTRYP